MSLSEIRDRLHRKSHNYFIFDSGRWSPDKRNMFYGATDALLDASAAARSYGIAISSSPDARLLACYGFLQALYIQQDAVKFLSYAVGLTWNPTQDERLKQIRDVRNRLTGHPVRAGETEKLKRTSSAIIPHHYINENGFRGCVYYDDHFEEVEVIAALFLNDNEERLTVQMGVIEKKIDEDELQFRNEEASNPLSAHFENGFPYLIQRLHCDLDDEWRVPQAQSHAKMIRERIEEVLRNSKGRNLWPKSASYNAERIFAGLALLEKIMADSPTSVRQPEFDVIYDGVKQNIDSMKNYVIELEARLTTPIG